MATKLVIVESPTKAHKIGDYLGKGYTVMASVGHIRDLAQPSQVPAADKAKFGKFGVDVNDGFKPYYIVDGDKKRTVSELKSALKNADELYLATDEDREGEAIAWHLVQTLKPEVPVKRMVFHEITKNAINASLNNTRDVDGNMVDAQETRRILDRLYGYELSPVLWRKVGPGLSAGRVQSVATRLIVERERERMAFKRAPYWDIVATLSAPDALGERAEFSARMIALGGKRLAGSKDFGADGQLTPDGFAANVRQLDEAGATAVASALKTADFTVMSMETKPYRRRPQPPFTTSTLQQTAGNRLGMGARAVMRAAQSLYENGYITYMRTDSVTLSQEGITAARNAVSYHFGDKFLSAEPKQYATKTAGAQEAHECIRPAGSLPRPGRAGFKLPGDQLRLYTLIWQRTLACQMADATGSTATVRLSAPASPRRGRVPGVRHRHRIPRLYEGHGGGAQAQGRRSRRWGWLGPGCRRQDGRQGCQGDASESISSLPPRASAQQVEANDIEPDGHEPSRRPATPRPRWSRRWKPRRSVARPLTRALFPQSWIAAAYMSVAVR